MAEGGEGFRISNYTGLLAGDIMRDSQWCEPQRNSYPKRQVLCEPRLVEVLQVRSSLFKGHLFV